MSESQEQQKLIHWWDNNREWIPINAFDDEEFKKLPWNNLLFAIPNGGLRDMREAAKLKREGVRRGFPDLMLAYPKVCVYEAGLIQFCPGLVIEMKFGNGSLSDYQHDFIEMLELIGYKVSVCYSFEEAKQAIEEYLND